MIKKKNALIILLACLLLLCGCGAAEKLKPKDPDKHYDIPAYLDVTFDESKAKGKNKMLIDLSHTSQGYFGAKGYGEDILKLQIIKGDDSYTFNLDNEGKVQYFPLAYGNGSYTIRILEKVKDNKYLEKYKVTAKVKLDDEFQPFLHPSIYVDYTPDSKAVALARELAEKSMDANDFISEVYKYVVKNIKYDNKKAKTVKAGYVPVIDEILDSRKGICFDYASLAAAMLRSQGIPTKMIFGYVAPDDLYHAWNMVYTEESGWITVSFSVDEKNWNRIDLTFSAGNATSKFIGNGENYSDLYQF